MKSQKKILAEGLNPGQLATRLTGTATVHVCNSFYSKYWQFDKRTHLRCDNEVIPNDILYTHKLMPSSIIIKEATAGS